MARKKTFRQLSLAAKRGWVTRRENLRRIQTEGINRREVGKWYQRQLDKAVEKAVKAALKEERKKHQHELDLLRNRLKREQRKGAKEAKRLRDKLRRAEKREREKEEIAKNPQEYVKKKLEFLWDEYGRDGQHTQIKRWIRKMSKMFSWPQDDLWHWYYSPIW